jgi:hypothetical protein
MVTPVFNPASLFMGLMGKRRWAMFPLQPKGGDYPTGPDTDVNPTTGATVCYAQGVVTIDPATGLAVSQGNPYASGALTPVNYSSGLVLGGGGAANAFITPPAGATAYLTSLTMTGSGSTAGATVQVAIAGLAGGSLSYTFVAPVGGQVSGQPLNLTFNPPLPGSAPGQTISASFPNTGAGSTGQSITAIGYYK